MKNFNKLLAVFMGLFVIYYSFIGNNFLYNYFLIILIIPFIFKIPPYHTLIFLVMMFLLLFLGGQQGLHLYTTTSWYDKFAHFLFGIFGSIPALWVLMKFKILKNSLWCSCIFIFCFGLTLGIFWEIFEFTVDTFLNTDMQRRATGVTDTMMDIIVCSIGHIVFILWYIFEVKMKKNGLITRLIEEMK